MKISRRDWIYYASTGGSVVLLGGWQLGRHAYARSSLSDELMSEAIPLLTDKADKEIESLPAEAREEIRDYFTDVCVRVQGFVAEICTIAFAEKLGGCASEEQKHRLLNVAFNQKVVTGIEMLNRFETIAREMGKQLDRNWAACCAKLSASWDTSLSKRSPGNQTVDLVTQLQPMILQKLDEARQLAYPVGQRPAIGQTLGEIGESEILLMAVDLVAPEIEFPLFVVDALVHFWPWILDQLSDRRADYQAAITEQLSLLGNRVGDEFQRELRSRIADLQNLQENSLREAAHRKAAEVIPTFF